MKKLPVPKRFITATYNLIIISILLVAVSYYFLTKETFIGYLYLGLGILTIGIIKSHRIEIQTVYPDIIFGFIDNGILVFTTILGGMFAGVTGAVIGGVAGNTITDGIGALFEGWVAEKNYVKKILDQRNSLSTTLGKVAGCLLGAGLGLILVSFFR